MVNTFYSAPLNTTGHDRYKTIKRYGTLALGIIVALIIIAQIYTYFTKGRIVIVTNSPTNTIALTPTSGNSNSSKVSPFTLHNGKSISVSPGSYTVLVKNSSSASSQIITIKARQKVRDVLNLTAPPSLETVANVNALYFTNDTSQLLYVDQGTKHLYKLDAADHLSLENDLAFKSIAWVNPAYGIATDTSGTVYQVQNGNVSALTLPSSMTSVVAYAISPDQHLYITDGKYIYKMTDSGGFDNIYTAANTVSGIEASDSRLAIISNLGGGSSESTLTIVDTSGKSPLQKQIDTYQVNWSPSGKYLVSTSDSGTQIYTSDLTLVATVPTNNLSNPAWINDSSLLYSSYDQIWEFSLPTGRTSVIASAQKNHAITGINIIGDKSYVYFSAQSSAGSNDDLSISRIGLNGQKPIGFIGTLQSRLPWLDGGCLLSLTNFVKPTVQIYGGAPEDNCTSVAQTFVQGLGVDPAKLSYQETDVPPDVPASF